MSSCRYVDDTPLRPRGYGHGCRAAAAVRGHTPILMATCLLRAAVEVLC